MARWIVGKVGFKPPVPSGWQGPYVGGWTNPLRWLAWADGVWCGLEYNPIDSTGHIWRTDDDGATWTDEGEVLGSGEILSWLGVANGVFFAGGLGGSGIASSTNGSSWAITADPFSPADGFIIDVIAGAGIYMAFSFTTHATALTPTGGWTLETRLGFAFIGGEAFVADRFLIKQDASGGTAQLWVDADGAPPWTLNTGEPDNTIFTRYFAELTDDFFPPRIVSMGGDSFPRVKLSDNRAVSWFSPGLAPVANVTKMVSMRRKVIALEGGTAAFLDWSDDGQTWHTSPAVPAAGGVHIDYGALANDDNDRVMVCTEDGEVYLSHPSTW